MTHKEIKKLEESFDRYKKALALVYADGDVTLSMLLLLKGTALSALKKSWDFLILTVCLWKLVFTKRQNRTELNGKS